MRSYDPWTGEPEALAVAEPETQPDPDLTCYRLLEAARRDIADAAVSTYRLRMECEFRPGPWSGECTVRGTVWDTCASVASALGGRRICCLPAVDWVRRAYSASDPVELGRALSAWALELVTSVLGGGVAREEV